MSNTIYILLVIGWVILNIVRATKKAQEAKKTIAPQPQGRTSGTDVSERTLQEALEGRREELEARQKVEEEKYRHLEESYDEVAFDTEAMYADGRAHDSEEVQLAFEDFNKKYKEQSSEYSSDRTTPHPESSEQNSGVLEDDLDMTKAVIYSEILKRPAF